MNLKPYQIWCHTWQEGHFEPNCIDYGSELLAIAWKCQRMNQEEVQDKIDNPEMVFCSYGVAQRMDRGNHQNVVEAWDWYNG